MVLLQEQVVTLAGPVMMAWVLLTGHVGIVGRDRP